MKEDKKGRERRKGGNQKMPQVFCWKKIIIFMKQQNEEKWKKAGDVG